MAEKHLRLIELLFLLQIAVQCVHTNVMEIKVGKKELQKVLISSALKFNWFEAEAECSRRDMLLITVDTAKKSAILNEILRENLAEWSRVWIGGQDLGREGRFVWTATGQPFTFTNWRHNMPDNYRNNEDCVHIGRDLQWNDAACSMKLGFVCEG